MYNYDCDSIIKLEKYYEIIMIMCIHYSVTIKNDSEIPIITRMKERLKPNTHPQNHKLSRLFQKKGTRQVSRIEGNKAQLVLDILSNEFDEKNTPLIDINTKELVASLIVEHIEYARLEEQYTLTKIQNAVRNVTKRIHAQEKQKNLEIDSLWSYHKVLQRLLSLLDSISHISDARLVSTTLDSDNELEIQDEYARSRGIYN
ncbi:MAG: hypothetical protein QG561_248 [Patescibacteria group bacterium]|nr:hypothetical protein [Patescibacteria group bacterium]